MHRSWREMQIKRKHTNGRKKEMRNKVTRWKIRKEPLAAMRDRPRNFYVSNPNWHGSLSDEAIFRKALQSPNVFLSFEIHCFYEIIFPPNWSNRLSVICEDSYNYIWMFKQFVKYTVIVLYVVYMLFAVKNGFVFVLAGSSSRTFHRGVLLCFSGCMHIVRGMIG